MKYCQNKWDPYHISNFFPLQATNEVIFRVPKATQEEMTAAVDSCSRAYHSWSETSILARQQIFLRYQQLIKDNIVGQRVRKYQIQLEACFLLSTNSIFCLFKLINLVSVCKLVILNHFTLDLDLLFAFNRNMLLEYVENLQIKNQKIDSRDILCFRKNWPGPSRWSRGRPSQMQREMCSEDCVSFLHSHMCKHTSGKGNKSVNVCMLGRLVLAGCMNS